MHFTGVNVARDLVEIVELPDKRWFVGTQFHPEYQSTVGRPHPLFKSFVEAAVAYAREKDLLEKPVPANRRNGATLAAAQL
jgi:CTP synthase